MLCISLGPFKFCNHIDREERAGCYNLFVFLVSCNGYCSVALPRGVLGWSAVGDFLYFLIILTNFYLFIYFYSLHPHSLHLYGAMNALNMLKLKNI